MQLKVNQVQLPDELTFNYEELKQGITEKASFYTNLVFTSEQMAEAKETMADLNKLKKALNDERIRQEKEYMKPFNDFKAKINEIINLIDEPVKAIDSQIKGFEEKQKEEKLEKIKEFWKTTDHPEWLMCNSIFDQKWLNASVSMKKVKEEICDRLTTIQIELGTLEKLPEFSFEAVEVYKQTLDINKAVSEGQRLADIQKRKAEAEAEKAKAAEEQPKVVAVANVDGQKVPLAEYPVETPDGQWLRFEAFLNVDQAKKLKEFFETNKISFRAI